MIATVACVAFAIVVFLSEDGLVSRLIASRHIVAAIPGVTLDDDDADNDADAAMPVVTSLRSDSEAQKRGLRVGDHIDAVDGRPVRSVAALVSTIDSDRGHDTVALHVRRGSAIWNVAIDRVEPADITGSGALATNDTQNPPR